MEESLSGLSSIEQNILITFFLQEGYTRKALGYQTRCRYHKVIIAMLHIALSLGVPSSMTILIIHKALWKCSIDALF